MSDEPKLVEKVTIDLADGSIVVVVVVVEVADGAAYGGWGISRVEVTSRTPVRPDFFKSFLDSCGQMILTSGIRDLIALHDAETESAP